MSHKMLFIIAAIVLFILSALFLFGLGNVTETTALGLAVSGLAAWAASTVVP